MSDQITSEQLLQEAYETKAKPLSHPTYMIQDLDELKSYQLRKRKDYEQQLNKNRLNYRQWIRYAKWELDYNRDFRRARSIFERALDVNVEYIPFWTQYIQFELSQKNINHARNLLDRAVTVLPRVAKLWFMYVQTEETLKNYEMTRVVFERWFGWNPERPAWDAYVNFEARYGEVERARAIFLRYTEAFSSSGTWLKWIEFEILQQNVIKIRQAFETSVNALLSKKDTPDLDNDLPTIVYKWAEWESSVKEFERARLIYDLILNNPKFVLPADQREEVYQLYVNFEKAHGNKDTIESGVLLKRKEKYESELLADPQEYDTWWSYIKLLQDLQSTEMSSAFKKGSEHVPSNTGSKSVQWRRYIYLWIKYALWEEFTNMDLEQARSVWKKCLSIIPHKQFSFSKVWIGYAEFEIRNSENGLTTGRKILGRAIGQVSNPKPSIFKYYIALEQRLGELDRVRKIYEKWIELLLPAPQVVEVFLQYIEFEKLLSEEDRCVSLFEFAIKLTTEVDELEPSMVQVWLAFIEYYKEEMNYERARELYEKLLSIEDTVKMWISFALFESSILSQAQLLVYEDGETEFSITEEHRESTRSTFQRAERHFKVSDRKQDRLVLLEAWKNYELAHGDAKSQQLVEKKLPTIVKKTTESGEEHIDYFFPSDEVKPNINKFLANAKKWASK